jgi:hypothetical protein
MQLDLYSPTDSANSLTSVAHDISVSLLPYTVSTDTDNFRSNLIYLPIYLKIDLTVHVKEHQETT